MSYKYKCLLEQILEERPNIVLFMTPDLEKIAEINGRVSNTPKKYVL